MVVTWTITQLEHKIANKFVTVAYWTATATDENYSSSESNVCGWPDGEPTIPYDELTQDIVLDWIWANGVDKEAIETILTSQIELQKNPVRSTGLPW
jgi:hypothetical protein